ncbi:MAG: radical SAM protein [Sarcina sp.]
MKNKYPIINYNYHLHLTAKDCSLFHIVKDNTVGKSMLGLAEFNEWKVNPLMARYLCLCDGKTTHAEIVDKLKIPFSILGNKGAKGLEDITKVLTFSDVPKECNGRLFITGNFESYTPLHTSIEITDYCNFRCKHCYVSASPDKLEKRSYQDMIKLMNKLWDNGVKVLEITGGECTTHPNFKEILKFASDKFNLVAVISNGYIIGNNEELAKYIASFNNVAVQISIDGIKEYHDEFRNMKGSFDRAVNAVKYLKKYGAIVRVASTVTYENVDNIEKVFKLCKNIGADSFATSTVSSFGRASCKGCNKGESDLKSILVNKLAPYKDDKLFVANYKTIEAVMANKDLNCGAGWRTFAINGASGDVRICLFLNEEGIIGNVDNDEYLKIFKKEKLDNFRFADAPSIHLDTCKKCEHKDICNGCMARAINIYRTEKQECEWIKKYKIDQSIKV